MFNRGKIKKLEEKLAFENERHNDILRLLVDIRNDQTKTSNNLFLINQKIDPKPSIVHEISTLSFAKKLQGYIKQKRCGSGGCGYYYMIPSAEIDSVVKFFENK